MPQRYKLRLGDGTIRLVDGDELRSWLGDGNAMVQTPGSYRWSPLRDFVTDEAALAAVPPKPRESEMPSDPAVPPPSDRVARPSRAAPTRVQALADNPVAIAASDAVGTPTDVDQFPTIPLKRLDDRDEESAGTGTGAVEDQGVEAVPPPQWRDRLAQWSDRLGQWLLTMVAALGTLLGRSLDRLRTRLSRPEPSLLEPPPAEPPFAEPFPTEPFRPPPPSERVVPRYADVPAPRKARSFFEDGDDGDEEGVSLIQTPWLWTRHSAVIAGLVAGGIFGVLTWQTWLPSVARLGQMMFTWAGRPESAHIEMEAQQRALRAATQQLPQLAPETIHLMLSGSPGGVLDPPELFQLAGDAADRGRSSLTPGEAKELKALQGDLVRTLRPVERRRVREYDRVRSSQVVFPSENRRVLELCARGARALPPRKRERLQVLLGKAIAAGLVRPWDTPIR